MLVLDPTKMKILVNLNFLEIGILCGRHFILRKNMKIKLNLFITFSETLLNIFLKQSFLF